VQIHQSNFEQNRCGLCGSGAIKLATLFTLINITESSFTRNRAVRVPPSEYEPSLVPGVGALHFQSATPAYGMLVTDCVFEENAGRTAGAILGEGSEVLILQGARFARNQYSTSNVNVHGASIAYLVNTKLRVENVSITLHEVC
jgi:hypothetical protein